MLNTILQLIDWFIPPAARQERSQLSISRFFVFTHLAGPAMAQAISVTLYLTDPKPGFACWTMIGCITSFWILPFAYKQIGALKRVTIISFQILLFCSLFGSYYYGGVHSPFWPWMVISLFLGFFYLSDKPILVISMFLFNFLGFIVFYYIFGFPELIPVPELAPLGWISIVAASVYISWLAVYYGMMLGMRSELQDEVKRHQETTARLEHARALAAAASQEKSIFVAKMSHELRTPLNAVIGYSELLLEDSGPLSPKAADLSHIAKAGKHLLALVTDVLDFTDIESEQIRLHIQRFDLFMFIDDIVTSMRPLMDAGGNKVVVQCDPQIGTVETDQTKLRQAVLNLLGNAAKFTHNGRIQIVAHRSKKNAGDWIEIAVEDTGIGISEADLPRLFSNFAQATLLTANKYGGTGLGLSLSQKLCGLLGGGITAESSLGRGSKFTIRIPAQISLRSRPNHPNASEFNQILGEATPQVAAG